MAEILQLDIPKHVATITITRPTMPPQFFDELAAVFEAIQAADDVRAVVIQASCKGFSYGLDLQAAFKEFGPLLGGGSLAGPRANLLTLIRRWQGAISAPSECALPVIAAVHGHCIGGGLDLISACDVRLCSADVTISLREAKLAIVADLGSLQRLPGIIGQGNTRELAYTAGDIDAQRAHAMGLVNGVFEDRDACQAAAADMAAEIAANPPLTVQGIKQVLSFGEGKPVSAGLDYVAAWNAAFLASKDLAEAMTAFLQRRKPEFTGE